MRSRGWLAVGLVLVLAACSDSSSSGGASTTTRPTTTTVPLPTPAVVDGSQLEGDVAFLGSIKTVPVGDVTMAFRQFGHGPDLLLIAGQASPMSLWPASLLASLAEQHRVTIYDNRDLGATSVADPFSLPDLADDAAGLVAALGLRRPAVFGWSTGGEIGLLLAARHPDSLSRLAISGASPGGPSSILPPDEIIDLFADPSPDTGKLLDVLFSPQGKAAQDAFLQDYVKVPQSTVTAEATKAYDDAEHAYWDAPEPRWEDIVVPVLVLNGEGDYAVPSGNARYIAERLGRRATLELDPGGRHAWFLEHPDHFRAALTPFLDAG
jgi:pimeloyl-ACP methyl ester carboxylesterase